MLNNKEHYPRIEKILAGQTKIDDKNTLNVAGVKRSFLVTLTDDDLAYFKTALVFNSPYGGVMQVDKADGKIIKQVNKNALPIEVLGAAHIIKGNSLVDSEKSIDPLSRFNELLSEYLQSQPQLRGLEMAGYFGFADPAKAKCVVFFPQPYTMPKLAQMSLFIKSLKSKFPADISQHEL